MDFHLPKKTQVQYNRDSYWNNKNPYQINVQRKQNQQRQNENWIIYLVFADMVCELSKKALFPLSIGQQAPKTERLLSLELHFVHCILFSSSFSSTGCLKNNDVIWQISMTLIKSQNLQAKSAICNPKAHRVTQSPSFLANFLSQFLEIATKWANFLNLRRSYKT